MNFTNLRIQTQEEPIRNLFLQAILCIIGGWIISKIISNIWSTYHVVTHTMFELLCIFIALSAFSLIWHSYERNSFANQLIGFGFLIVAIFDIFHNFYAPDLKLYPHSYFDLSARCWIFGRLVEAVVLIVAVCFGVKKEYKINKWIGLVTSITLGLGTSFIILYNPKIMPVLFINGAGVTPLKVALEYVCIALFLIGLFKIKDKINDRDILTYRYIFIALLIAIPAELCFTIFKTTTSFVNVYGHILKVIYYYYLYRGIYISAVHFPYEKLENVNKFMEKLLNGLPQALTMYDDNNKLCFANNKALEVLGCTSKQIIGLSDDEMINRFSRPKLTHPVRNKILTIKNSNGKVLNLQFDKIKLDPQGYIHMFSEVIKEQEIQNLQLQTKTILNAMSNSFIMINKSKEIIMCNKAFEEIYEIKIKDIIGEDVDQLCEIIQFSHKNIPQDVLNGEIILLEEVLFTTPKGNQKILLLNASPIYNINGEIIGAIGVGSDITKLKEQHRIIQQQEKLSVIGIMAAGIVHEIKNPLAAIKGFSQLILTKTQEEVTKQYASIIDNEVNGANKVVSDFLTFAKPQKPVIKAISVNTLVKSIQFMLESQAFIKGVEADITCNSNVTVMVDNSQIKQVLLNIINNAIEAMSETGKPKLTIITGHNQEANEIFITIADNGKGISKEDLSKIGVPFHTTKDKGTGLGMSICFQIIKEHGGRIHVDSELGKGTTFTIYIPCKKDNQELCVS